jgi:hypothetical protein
MANTASRFLMPIVGNDTFPSRTRSLFLLQASQFVQIIEAFEKEEETSGRTPCCPIGRSGVLKDWRIEGSRGNRAVICNKVITYFHTML